MSTVKPNFRMLGLALVVGAGAFAVHVAAQPADQVIKVAVKKFDYTPNQITLKKGVPVVLEFSTADVVMGFNAPDLNTRADIFSRQGDASADRARQGRYLRLLLRHLLRLRPRGHDRDDRRRGVMAHQMALATMLTDIASTVMLKTNDRMPWISVMRRTRRVMVSTSDTCDVMPTTKE